MRTLGDEETGTVVERAVRELVRGKLLRCGGAVVPRGTRAGAEVAPTIDWERLARSELNPVRLDIIEVFSLDGGRGLSATEVAFETRLPLSNVIYHVKALVKAGVLPPVAEWTPGARSEQFYCLEGGYRC